MEQFDQLLTCAICLDRYRIPKLLPCQHSFCMEPCMEGLVNYVTRQVKCPECRAEHRIPYQGVQAYPTNVTLQRFLELHIEITGELPDPTSGQIMERCNVCSEKNYCTLCSHCDKKVCADCKEGHLDILRREIARVNNQVRRTLHRLQDALSVIEKNSLQLQQNCASITDEIDDIYRRLSKALKERTDYLKSEIEVFQAKEMRSLTSLKENLEQEIHNFESNSEFAEKQMGEGSAWEDNELMDAKDILLRTMEFIRNFECEPGEYHRRVRFTISQDPNQLAATLGGLGELTINAPPQVGAGPQLTPPTLTPGLMRSKSDHRVAAQFRQAEERYLAYGSDNNDGRTSPVGGRRYFGDRSSTRYGSAADSSRRGDYDYDSPSLDSSDSVRRPRFRSRFMRHLDSGDSDNEPTSRSVRFNEQAAENAPQKKEREKVLDTEDATRGPLSGITKLLDSPRVISRLHEMENKDKKKEKAPTVTPPAPVQQSQPAATPARRAGRQVSEEDEISKIKKQNKAQESQSSAATADSATAGATATPASQVAQRKTSSSTQPESHPSTPTSTDRPRFPTTTEKVNVSRQTSTSSSDRREEVTSAASETEERDYQNQRRRPAAGRSLSQQSESQGARQEASRTTSSSSSTAHAEASQARSSNQTSGSYSKPGSQANTSQDDDRNGSGRTSRIGRLSVDRFKTRSTSSDGSTSTESSTHSSPVRNTGAAFTTEEIRNRYARKSSVSSTQSPTSPTPSTTTTEAPTRSRYGAANTTATPSRYGATSGSSANTASSTAAAPRFQSRFLGRPGTPTAEASRGSESSTSSSEDSSESESESEHEKPVLKTTREKELARTDIGPLLARSAHARDSSTYPRNEPSTPSYSNKSEPTTSYARSRGAAATVTSPPTSTRPTPSSAQSRYGSDSTSSNSRYGGTDYLTPTALTRSRTGSALHSEDLENKYPLASKYLNRSRANMSDSPSTDSTPVSSRYGGYRSRFLNKSKSSAALASDKDGDEDRNEQDDVVDSETGNDDDRQVQSRGTSSNLASGEERYPSGRSRYAALKDRRSRLARSRSSHEMSTADEPYDLDSGNGQGGEAGDTEASSSDRTGASGAGSSLSTWARYLKSKYGPRNKEDHQEEETNNKQRLSRARSAGSTPGSRPISPSAGQNEDQDSTGTQDSAAGLGARHQYMQKRKVQFKFGNRGSEKGAFTWPRGVAAGPDNTIVIADSSNHRVQVFDSNGRFLKEFGHYGSGEGEFDCLAGVAVNRIGQYIIADRYNHRIQVFDPSGRFLRVFGSQGSADGKFSYPWGVTTDALGFIYVCDKENHRVQVFQSDGTFVGKFGSLGNKPGQLEHPHYIAVSCTNRVIVSDSNNHRIQVFDVNGRVVSCFGSEGSEEGQFKFPRGVSVDDQGYIVVADSGNNRIQIFSPEGVFLRAFGCWGSGDGEFKGLEGIAVMANGNIVVCDRENHRIQVF